MTLPPDGRFTESLILPANGPAVHVPPFAPRQVVEHVSEAGNVSATVAPVAVLGPALLAVIEYVTEPPAVAVVTPSLFVIERSALAESVSVSVAELLPGFASVTPPGEVTVAVLLSEPLARLEIEQIDV